jgi:hypothetical protein
MHTTKFNHRRSPCRRSVKAGNSNTAGYEAREYTGRGDRNLCVASSVESATQFQADMTLAAADGGGNLPTVKEVAKLFKVSRVDSLGKREIVYFPSIEWVEVEE